jgi:RNA polymerase sigma factor (sigma-70 family)
MESERGLDTYFIEPEPGANNDELIDQQIEENRQWLQYAIPKAAKGDEAVTSSIVDDYGTSLAESVIHNYFNGFTNEKDDLIQEGRLALLRVIEKYKEGSLPDDFDAYNYCFSSVKNAMSSHLRTEFRHQHPGFSLDLVKKLGLDPIRIESLDQPVTITSSEDSLNTFEGSKSELLPDTRSQSPYQELIVDQILEEIFVYMNQVPPLQQGILTLFLGLTNDGRQHTYEEIAETLHISRAKVGYWVRKQSSELSERLAPLLESK